MPQIIHGNALDELSKLPDESVDCCITSPPYWALRDYKVVGQLGLEPTIDEYITKLVEIFDQVQRVLKKTGSCWVVIGDTYAAGTRSNRNGMSETTLGGGKKKLREIINNPRICSSEQNISDKSLCMIPERFSIKMIDHGWILRNKIVWYKPNCMPSSAKDRFTVDWEYVYFFTKSQRYFFETQYEPIQETSIERDKSPRHTIQCIVSPTGTRGKQILPPLNALGRIKRCVWKISTKPFSGAHFAVFPPDLVLPMIKAGCPLNGVILDPFFGAGTVGLVALQNNRDFVGIELNPEYIEIAKTRLNPLLNQQKLG